LQCLTPLTHTEDDSTMRAGRSIARESQSQDTFTPPRGTNSIREHAPYIQRIHGLVPRLAAPTVALHLHSNNKEILISAPAHVHANLQQDE
jgi:hypothetical protein